MNDQLMPADTGMSAMALLSDEAIFNRMVRFSELMASGKATIPVELRNPGDCLAITMQAMTWKMNPFNVAQKTFFIKGKIGYEAQLLAAAVENSGAIVGGFDFEWFGPWENIVGKFEIKKNSNGDQYRIPGWKLEDEEGIGIKVSATKKGENTPKVLELLLCQAQTRNSTQWADDPKLQLAYLAEKKWARLYTPKVIMGAYTPDELEDPIPPAEKDVTAQGSHQQPTYTVEEFEKKKDAWKTSMLDGNKPADRFIAFVESRGKKFTDAMKAEIHSWKKAPEKATGQTIEGEAKQVDDPFVADMNAAEATQQSTGAQ